MIVDWDERMMRRESSSGAFAMHEKSFVLAVDQMLLDFGNVMRHVVDEMHVEIVGRGLEDFGERLSRQKCHAATIDPRVVGRGAHAFQVVLAFG